MQNKPIENKGDKEDIPKRKLEGINIPLRENVEAKGTTTLLEFVHLIHNALPEIDLEEIDTSTTFLTHKFSSPLLIDAMTGGTDAAATLNATLAAAAEENGLGMVVGSQRAGLKSEELAETYAVTRRNAPTAFIAANIGAPQLAKGFSLDEARRLIDMIRADAFVIHLNPLQELIQPEGEPRFAGVLDGIKEIVPKIGVPVIVKEVGAGISKEVAIRLELAGVSAINVSGAGGTSWAGVEQYRASAIEAKQKVELGNLFWDWGIPTAASLIEVRRSVKLPLIASGGIRNGLEIAKCVALGASLCGMALPLLRAANVSKNSLNDLIHKLVAEFRAAMYLVGAGNVSELAKARRIVMGPLAERLASSSILR